MRILCAKKLLSLLFLFCISTVFANINFSHQLSGFSVHGGTLTFLQSTSNWKGTLDIQGGSIAGNPVFFDNGIYKKGSYTGLLHGSLNPNGLQGITLDTGKKIIADPGISINSTTILGTGNVLSGQPTLVDTIILANSFAELQINISNRLSKSIIMNNGTIKLLNDLTLADDVTLSGSGVIDFNERRLNLPGKTSTWSNSLVFYNPTDITLNSKTTLSGKWTFSGSNGVLNGNGNILDLTSGGTLQIGADMDVQFTDVHINGLGQIYGSLIFDNTSSRIRLSNCSLQISTSYTLANGGIIFEGGNSSIITGSDTLYLAPSFGLTVDHITVFGDALNGTSTVNVSPNIPNNIQLTYLNKGILRSIANNENLSSLVDDNSAAIVGWIADTSNAMVSVQALVDDNSWAIVATNELAIDNSWAIENLDERIIANSDAVVTAKNLAVDNSGAIVSWIADTSNAMVSVQALVDDNSWAIENLEERVTANSWSIENLDERIVANSWAIQNLDERVTSNSWAIENLDERVTANSWSIVNIDERVLENSWSIINIDERVIANSNAVVTNDNLAKDNSNAIVGWIKNTSDAMVSVQALVDDNSWAIVATNELAIENSWAIENLDERIIANSDAVVTAKNLAVDNSGAIVSWILDTSNVMISLQELVDNNSWELENLYQDIAANSDAIITVNNLAVDNSGAIVSWIADTSNAMVSVQALVHDNSWAIVVLDELATQNSNALVSWVIDTSNAVHNFVLYNSQAIVTIAELNLANSYAIASLDELTEATSWAVISARELAIANSDAILANQELDIQTSHAVVRLAAGLGTIDHGPAHVHMSANTTLSYNLNISPDHQLRIHSSGFFDGAGHAVTIGRSGIAIAIDAAVTVTLQNLVLKDYSDSRMSLGAGASLLFGQNVVIELAEKQTLSRTWTFAGHSIIKGQAEELVLGTGENYIVVLPNASLTLQDVMITNIGFNNLRCMGNTSGLVFDNAHLQLGPDYTFSSGYITIAGDTHISGTTTFNYATDVASTIASGAKLYLDLGSTFNYAPSVASKDLLVMTDSMSQLYMTGATLSASTTGCILKKGTLILDGLNYITSAATNLVEGIEFGDGTPANDLIIKVLPASELRVTSGFLNYNNAN